MSNLKKIKTPLLFIPLVLIGFGVYHSGLGIQYYNDDYQFVFDSPSSKILHYFTHNNQFNNFYRPIQAAFLAVVQTLLDTSTLPIHVTQILLHILLSWLIFSYMKRLGLSMTQAALGSVFMLVSQANVHAVLSNDTLSQIGGTAFGCVSLIALHSFLSIREKEHGAEPVQRRHSQRRSPAASRTAIGTGDSRLQFNRNYIISITMYALSLLSKESGISFFPLLVFIIILCNTKTGNRKNAAGRSIAEAAPYLAVTILYFIARLYIVEAQPSLGSERYSFNIGINVVKNLAMFLFAASTPLSSVRVFEAFAGGEIIVISSAAATSLAFIAITVYGLRGTGRFGMVCILGAFAVTCLFPMAMLNHVSELYVYNSMPFISILVGMSLGGLVETGRPGKIRRGFLRALIGLLLVSHITAVRSKAAMMKSNGERAGRLLDQIVPYAYKVPENGSLFLLNPPGSGIIYSVFHLRGFNVLKGGVHRIKQLSGRNDMTIKIIYPPDVERLPPAHGRGRLILSLHGDTVGVYGEQRIE